VPRIRSIKPEFFTSEIVASLPLRTRLTWIGLWTHCDNYGRAKDNAKLIKAAVWPLDDVSTKDIESDLNTLADCRLVVRYSVAGKPYLAVANWVEHQYGANKGDPKFPGPDSADAEIPEQSRPVLDASRTNPDPSSPSQGMDGKGHDGKDALARGPTDRFDDFWDSYPRKSAKPTAERAFAKAVGRADIDTIVGAAKRFRDDPNRDEAYTPHAATWLNQDRWNDDPLPARANGRRPTDQDRPPGWEFG
jgi:hypothetical protein